MQVCRRFTLIFTPIFMPVIGAPCFVNSKWCGIDVVRPAYVGQLSYDCLLIYRQNLLLPLNCLMLMYDDNNDDDDDDDDDKHIYILP